MPCSRSGRWSPGVTRPTRDQARQASRAHREAWLTGYRGVLGFATLVLVDNPASH
ncbi:hypothetical protein GCM10023153_21340 [Ornithinibacter aureus]|uniref:Uncharacterized protein n=1 Tax=Ornithinibacter aureus TaxID=622664 RepID=A0ABP8JY10_9MICO